MIDAATGDSIGFHAEMTQSATIAGPFSHGNSLELPLICRSASEGSAVNRQTLTAESSDKLVLTEALSAEIDEANAKLETAQPQEVLRWAIERFGSRFTMATAFGPEGMVLIHMLAEIGPQTPIFNLDTG